MEAITGGHLSQVGCWPRATKICIDEDENQIEKAGLTRLPNWLSLGNRGA